MSLRLAAERASLADLGRRTGPSGWVCGLDLSAEMLSVARSKIGRRAACPVALAQGDALCLPFPNDAFDAAFLSFTLELFPASEIPLVLGDRRLVDVLKVRLELKTDNAVIRRALHLLSATTKRELKEACRAASMATRLSAEEIHDLDHLAAEGID